ncbi:hypothetical protein HUN08_13110 [Gordonia sp. X0973]|uniref:hypothetical protein n=1 Tax=Gordonia sp. X0973 TaxID=2742602 RepID=UPI0013ED6536|nr:hypothetical protein [Gordonia sp. X0973]QKT08016.1 hypothetical protein HUN08_13110 [Gordonia sp. X0973]
MVARSRKHLTTIVLAIVFVILLGVYLSNSADRSEQAPPRPTITVEKVPNPSGG